MKRTTTYISALVLSVFAVSEAVAQANFQFTIQSWASYTTYDHYTMKADSSGYELDETTTQFGNGIRRARLRGKMTKGPV